MNGCLQHIREVDKARYYLTNMAVRSVVGIPDYVPQYVVVMRAKHVTTNRKPITGKRLVVDA